MPRRRPRAPRARGAHNLGPFEKPGEPYRMSHIRKWQKYGVGDEDLLWGPYWERFNTVPIPIFGETEYFNYALEIAKLAKGSKEEFERIYTRRNKERLGEFLELLEKADNRAFWKHEEFPCEDAADKICAVCKTGALEDFARLLKGIAFGWEADTVHDAQPDDHPSEAEGGGQSSDSYAGSDYGYWIYEQEEIAQWNDPKFREEYAAEMAACVTPLGVWTFQRSAETTSKEDVEPAGSTSCENAYDGSSAQKRSPPLLGGAPVGDEEKQADDNKGEARLSLDVDDGNNRDLIRDSLAAPTISQSPFPIQQTTGQGLARTGSADDAGSHDYDHLRLQGASVGSPEPCASLSAQQPRNDRAATKRARRDDDGDGSYHGDGGSKGYKRRKLKTPLAPEAETKSESDGNKGGCRQRSKEKDLAPRVRSAQLPDAGVINTRSRGRSRASTLWELDSLGRPRSIS